MPLYPHSIPRCQHIKVNGTQCGSPALRRHRLCYFHKSWQQTRIVLGANRARRAPAVFDLPMLEDANSIQVALMQVMRLILGGQIDAKNAGLLLYALQTASTNLARTNFEPTIKTRVVIDPRTVDQTPLGEDPWRREDYEEEEYEEPDDQKENEEVVVADEGSPEEEIPQIQAVAEAPKAKQQGAPFLALFASGGRGHKADFGRSIASALHEGAQTGFTPRMGAITVLTRYHEQPPPSCPEVERSETSVVSAQDSEPFA
jgi:hypothetical protein